MASRVSCAVAVSLMLMCCAARAAEPVDADRVLLKLLDSEAIYTVRGSIKPISEGFWQTRFDDKQTTTPEIDGVRAILACHFPAERFATGVNVFAKAHDSKRFATAFIADRALVRGIVLKYPALFAPLDITWFMEPGEILARVDRAEEAARWRGFGLLFGYPEDAVEFFVEAGVSQKKTGKFVERDFRHIPTFASKDGNFVYAVAKGSAETWLDRDLKRRAEPILADYQRWRGELIGDGKPGAAAILAAMLAADSPPILCRPVCSLRYAHHVRFR